MGEYAALVFAGALNFEDGKITTRAGAPIRRTRQLPRAPGKGGRRKWANKTSEIKKNRPNALELPICQTLL